MACPSKGVEVRRMVTRPFKRENVPAHFAFAPAVGKPHASLAGSADSGACLPVALALALPMCSTSATCNLVTFIPAGVDTMASYEEVLHLLRYRNWHSRSLLGRKFKLICSELNGRYVSNEFQVEVSAGLPWRRAPCGALRFANADF